MVTPQALSSASRQRDISRIRQAMVYIGKKHYRLPTLGLARYLGQEASAISMMTRRMRDEEKSPEIQTLQKALEIKVCEL